MSAQFQPLTAAEAELLNPARVERMRHEASTNGRPGLLIDNDIVVAMCEAIQSHGRQAETIRELKAALTEEQRKFQAETLRTSALTQLLIRAEAVLCPEHEPGAWSRSCERCSVVADSRKLRATPLNAVAGVEARAALVGLVNAVDSERYVEGTPAYRRALEVLGRTGGTSRVDDIRTQGFEK